MAFATDYVEVRVRLQQFLEKFPEGRIQTEIVKHTDTIVIVKASVYRDALDDRPSVAHSQLGIPGKTNFTRDSETENAETSAVGRALAFMGFETKESLASREEVQSRQSDEHGRASDTPYWLETFATGLKERDMKVGDCRSVIPGLTNTEWKSQIDAWLREGPDNSVDNLLTQAMSAKAVKQAEAVKEGEPF